MRRLVLAASLQKSTEAARAMTRSSASTATLRAATHCALVFNDSQTRGVADILIAVTNGLKGMSEALAVVYPATTLQTCIVHLIRNNLDYVGWRVLRRHSELSWVFRETTTLLRGLGPTMAIQLPAEIR